MELATQSASPAAARRGIEWWQLENREMTLRDDVRIGYAYSEIARRMRTSIGSICGKVKRLKIGKGQQPRPYTYFAPTPDKLFAPADAEYYAVAAQLEAEARRRSGLTVAHDKIEARHCRFVIGDQGRVCGVPRLAGLPYCQEHMDRCYVHPPKPRSDYDAGEVSA